MKRILVTGAAGFIGSRVAARLLAEGFAIIGLDNLNDAYDPRLKQHRLELLRRESHFSFYEVDIARRGALDFLTEGGPIEAVVNLAARAGVRQSVEDPWVYLEANAAGTVELLEFCRSAGISRFILASTSSLYGRDNPMPYRENANTDRPISPYAASKKAAEAMAYTYHALYGLDVTVFRFFTVYGPAGRPDMSVFRFIQGIAEDRPIRIFGDGSQSRDFTYVEDVARGVVGALSLAGFATINLGSDRPVTINEVVSELEGIVGRKARIHHEPMPNTDVPATWADISTAAKLLGWRPEVTLEEGLRLTVEWYLANREWAKDIETK